MGDGPVQVASDYMRNAGVSSVLEVGCGIGGILAQVHRCVGGVAWGVDAWAAHLVEGKRRHPNLQLRFCDLAALGPWLDRCGVGFDAVIGFDVLEHLSASLAQEVRQTAERSARKVVAWWGPVDDPPKTFPSFTNPGMPHVRAVPVSDFEGYEITLYPGYWKSFPDTGARSDATGCLAIKRMGG